MVAPDSNPDRSPAVLNLPFHFIKLFNSQLAAWWQIRSLTKFHFLSIVISFRLFKWNVCGVVC